MNISFRQGYKRWFNASLAIGLLLASGGVGAKSLVDSPIEIALVTSKATYLDTDPVKMEVRVKNGLADTLAQKGFFSSDFLLQIVFTDSQGNKFRPPNQSGPEPEGAPGRKDASGVRRPAVGCERIAANDEIISRQDDMRVFVDLPPGSYKAQVVTSLVIFNESVGNALLGNLNCFLDTVQIAVTPNTPPPLDANVVSNVVSFKVVSAQPALKSDIELRARLIEVGSGERPPVKKTPLANVLFKLIRLASLPPDFQPPNHKNYAQIWEAVSRKIGLVATARTGSREGIARFYRVDQDAYLLLGRYTGSSETRFISRKVEPDEPEWGTESPIKKNAVVVQNHKGQKQPGKVTRRRGSDLVIIEPHYVEWNSGEEPYPFVFESVGDWSVETTVSPPEGFVADHDSLSAEVIDETEAIQFTLIDVGSRWEETGVTFRVKHKGREEFIESKVGVRLGKEVQARTGLGRYGHTASPGTFKGGRKVKEDEHEKDNKDKKDKKSQKN